MLAAFDALLPVLLVIAVGAVLRSRALLTPDQWIGFEKIAYYVLFPAIIIHTLSTTDFGSVPAFPLGLTLFLAILTMAVIVLALHRLIVGPLGLTDAAFTSVFQGSMRWNTPVGIAMAGALYGRPGVALIAVAIIAMIPTLNVLCVGALVRYGNAERLPFKAIVLDLIRNPFIWSCAVGIAINLSGLTPPKQVLGALELMGRSALAAGLLAVGAGLRLSTLARPKPAHLLSSALRLTGMPLLAAGFGAIFGLEPMALGVAIVAMSVPTSTGAYLLARQMGGDHELMAEIITLQSIVAIVTMPVAIAVLAPTSL
ncbi:MAG: AEC family transporter [Hyphomicrobiales bacterium]|nr:MAG: AEC family transporter [Hyphomicrobiales bacterium]